MKQILFAFLVLIVTAGTSFAQNTHFSACNNQIRLRVKVMQDPAIELLLCAHREVVERKDGIRGFRIQITSEGGAQSRQRIFGRQSAFNSRYPNVKSYVTYDAPDFKLRVGNFKTRIDAQRFLNHISHEFPGSYIVIDQIEVIDEE